MNKETELKVLSLFDGISCARVAIERAGFKIEEYYASEIDKYAMQIARKNYIDTIELGNVVDIKPPRYGNLKNIGIDILIGGSPCQDLSIAGKRKGLCGARSGLFYEYVRIRDEVKPKYFILENVNSMSKEAKDTISKELGVEPIMINAALVSAQNRKRLFWVGKLVGDKYEQVDIELPEDKGILLKDILEDEVEEKYFINDSYIKNLNRESYGAKGSIANENEKTKTLTASMGCGGGNGIYVSRPSGAKTGLYHVPHGYKKEKVTQEDKYPTLHAQSPDSNHLLIEPVIRKLTPIECERLQSLPDNYTEGVSNTQRYKGLGNAFNVDVVAHIIKSLSKEEVKQNKLL